MKTNIGNDMKKKNLAHEKQIMCKCGNDKFYTFLLKVCVNNMWYHSMVVACTKCKKERLVKPIVTEDTSNKEGIAN